MASLTVSPAPFSSAAIAAPFERRLQAEWTLLTRLSALNPGRLKELRADDTTLHVLLAGTPALSLDDAPRCISRHALRIVYPRFFPALPLELYLETPVLHPNIHPETGFVCLWDRHRVANTVEHALHKTVAILGWRLFNLDPAHVMQTGAAALSEAEIAGLVASLDVRPLEGIKPQPIATPARFRRRLS